MDNEGKKLKLVTHNGSFHADDVFACATLFLVLKKTNQQSELIRTRNEEIIKNGDIVFDVGGVYDAEKNRFDHHQVGGAGKRANGIDYASFGLVWKKFGIEICDDEKTLDFIDKKLVSPIDAADNGIDLVENKHNVSPYFIQNFISSMKPTWREDATEDEMFLKSVAIASDILSREIIQTQDAFLAESAIISSYQNSADKRIIILDEHYPYEYVLQNFSEPLFVIYPRKITKDWGVRAVRKDTLTFNNRKDLPKSWGGLQNEELQKLTGVEDAIFCHRGLFLAVAKSKEGAIKLAEIALQANPPSA